jgi:hypothetical protein
MLIHSGGQEVAQFGLRVIEENTSVVITTASEQAVQAVLSKGVSKERKLLLILQYRLWTHA